MIDIHTAASVEQDTIVELFGFCRNSIFTQPHNGSPQTFCARSGRRNEMLRCDFQQFGGPKITIALNDDTCSCQKILLFAAFQSNEVPQLQVDSWFRSTREFRFPSFQGLFWKRKLTSWFQMFTWTQKDPAINCIASIGDASALFTQVLNVERHANIHRLMIFAKTTFLMWPFFKFLNGCLIHLRSLWFDFSYLEVFEFWHLTTDHHGPFSPWLLPIFAFDDTVAFSRPLLLHWPKMTCSRSFDGTLDWKTCWTDPVPTKPASRSRRISSLSGHGCDESLWQKWTDLTALAHSSHRDLGYAPANSVLFFHAPWTKVLPHKMTSCFLWQHFLHRFFNSSAFVRIMVGFLNSCSYMHMSKQTTFTPSKPNRAWISGNSHTRELFGFSMDHFIPLAVARAHISAVKAANSHPISSFLRDFRRFFMFYGP